MDICCHRVPIFIAHVIRKLNNESYPWMNTRALCTPLVNQKNIYILLTEREVHMGEYWSSSLFTCCGSVHTHVKRELDPPFGPSARSINDLLYAYKLVWTLSLFDYKSKQIQEETTAVQYTRKHTTWGNSDWLTFSRAKIWLDGKLTSENQFKKSKWVYGYFTQRIRKFEWKGY